MTPFALTAQTFGDHLFSEPAGVKETSETLKPLSVTWFFCQDSVQVP